jgi:hypothetical protein
MFGAIGFLSLKVNSSSVLGTSTEGSITLSTNPNPLKPGPAIFLIDVKDKNGKVVDDAKVLYNINMTTMDMGAQNGTAVSQGNGRYSISAKMTMLGPWKVSVTVKMIDGSINNKDFTVNVR